MSTPEYLNTLLIARQMTALSPQVSLIDSETANGLLASVAELHVNDPASVHWWTSLRNADTFFYGNDGTAWARMITQKASEMDGTSLFVSITDDEPGPWPVLRIENKFHLVELIKSLHFFEYMAFQEDARRLLFDTHANTIVSSSV